MAALFLSACSPDTPPPKPAPAALPADVLSQGQGVYEMLCATCHYDGKVSDRAPVLLDSPSLKNPADVINGILRGRKGNFQINGTAFEMPAQDNLSDDDIAAVVTYVRHEFGKTDQLTTPAEVAKLR